MFGIRRYGFALLVCMVLLVGCGDGGGGKSDVILAWDSNHNWDTGKEDTGGNEPDTGASIFCQSAQDCPAELPACDYGSKKCVECMKDEQCSGETPHCHPATKICVQCIMDGDCPTGFQHCLSGSCSNMACTPKAGTCVGNSVHVCSPDGMDPDWEVTDCGEKICYNGTCRECHPSETECKGNAVIECNSDGSSYEVIEQCSSEVNCYSGKCLVCYPGAKKCENNSSYICRNDGSGWEFNQDCAATGLNCTLGVCISPCQGDMKENSNAGCEFYAVDLDNANVTDELGNPMDASSAQFAVIASNTSADQATVTVTLPDGTPQTAVIPSMSLKKFELPKTWGLNNTEKAKKAFRINSNRPITVYQFNPLTNEQVFSNDASVLLPTPSLGTEYYVMSYPQQGGLTFRGFFTIVGLSTTPTEVTITPSAKTLAGAGLIAYNKGQTFKVTLNQGEVLNVECDDANGDFTGTKIVASADVAVFGGHEASTTADQCCADHMEQQMTPVDTWGSHYIVAKTSQRWMEKDHVRILAASPNTTVTLKPAVASVPTLQPGQVFSFTTGQDVEITASEPVMVAQFLASSYEILNAPNADMCSTNSDCPPNYTCDFLYGCMPPTCMSASNCPSGHTCEPYDFESYCEPIGDPTMILSVPEEQFLSSYVFLAPDAYLKDYANIIAPLDATQVTLDSTQIAMSNFKPIGSSGYGVYIATLTDGVHTVTSDKKVGVVVYGYDNDVSYGYPGGMALKSSEK